VLRGAEPGNRLQSGRHQREDTIMPTVFTSARLNHCRLCGKHEIGDNVRERMVKYATRHYAHFHCFLNAGKKAESLNLAERERLDAWLRERPFFRPVRGAK